MLRFSIATAFVLALAACSGDDEVPLSATAEPTVELTQVIDEQPVGFPCPPFEGVYVDAADVHDDADSDGLSNCQEAQIGSDPNDDDFDDDGIIDGIEITDLLEPDDFDNDGTPNWQDTDDDDDGCPTLTEGMGDLDKDGKPSYLDPNDNPCPGDTGATGDTGTTTTTDTDTSTDTDTDTSTGSTGDTGSTSKTSKS